MSGTTQLLEAGHRNHPVTLHSTAHDTNEPLSSDKVDHSKSVFNELLSPSNPTLQVPLPYRNSGLRGHPAPASPTAGNVSSERLAAGASSRRQLISPVPLGSVAGLSSANNYLRDEYCHDKLYSVIVDALTSLFNMKCLDELAPSLLTAFESLLYEHYQNPQGSRLRSLAPGIGLFLTPLPFAAAFAIYNQKYCITKRLFVPPTFHEIRHIMNIAQIMALRRKLRLVTFDGDETLYPDGRDFDDMHTAHYITMLLQGGCYIAVVTAAGYGYQTEKYESRLRGLLRYFAKKQLPPSVVSRFFLFGGESNYLIRCGANYHLEPVPEKEWRPHVSDYMKAFFGDEASPEGGADVRRLLDVATKTLEDTAEQLALRAVIVRKERAVGLVPGGLQGRQRKPMGSGTTTLKPEILEETVFRVRQAVLNADPPLQLPFCAFNGGHDVWVDVGNKAEGLLVLQSYLGVPADGSLHIGDQFSVNGNDTAARHVSPTLWICNPSETKAVLRSLLRQMNLAEFQTGEEPLSMGEDELASKLLGSLSVSTPNTAVSPNPERKEVDALESDDLGGECPTSPLPSDFS